MNGLEQYGVLGVVVIAMAWYILNIEKRHKEERDEWRRTIDRQFDEQSKNTKESTSILSGLKTLIESMRK